MKKIVMYIIVLFFCFLFSSNVFADNVLSLEEPVIQFKKIKYYSLQGYTVVNDKLFMVLEGYDDTKSIIKVYDLNTYKEIISYEYNSLGHANDITYNMKNNKIYIIASGGSDVVFQFNGDTFMYEDNFNISLPARSITYIESMNSYAVRTISNGYLFNSNFSLKRKFPFIFGMNFSTDVGRQGWTCYKDIIYYANWSWIKQGGNGANAIFTYDLNGNKLTTIYTENNIGEIEGVDFYNNKMLLGFNGYDGNIKFYMSEIPKINISENKEDIIDDIKIVKKKNNNLFIIISVSVLFIFIFILIIIKFKKST